MEYCDNYRFGDVQVHLNNHCNYRCKHCYTGSSIHFQNWLPLNHYRDILSFVHSNPKRKLRILGGEIITPDLRIKPYLELANQWAIKPVVCTNGHNDMLWINGHISPNDFREVIVSMYGFESSHDSITTVPGSFRKSKNVVEYLSSFTPKFFKLTVNTLILATNKNSFQEFIYWLSSIPVDEIKILKLSPLGAAIRNLGNGYRTLAIDSSTRRQLVHKIRNGIRNRAQSSPLILWEPEFDNNMEADLLIRCRVDRSTMVTIDNEGFVFLCHLLISQKQSAIGRLGVTNDSLDMILNHQDSIVRKHAIVQYTNNKNRCPAYTSDIGINGSIFSCPLYLETVK